MSRVDPENSRIHSPDQHTKMAPADLLAHIEDDHYPYPSEVMADWYLPDVVDQVLRDRGIPAARTGAGDGAYHVEAWELDGLTAWHVLAHEAAARRFAHESIAYSRDRHAKQVLGQAEASASYLVSAVYTDDYDPMRHGKERKGVRVDLGVTRRYSQSCWPVRCLVCPQELATASTRSAAGSRLTQHHEAAHPRKLPTDLEEVR